MSENSTKVQAESKRGIYLTVLFLLASGALMFWMMVQSDRQYGPGAAMQNNNTGDPAEAANVDGPPSPGTQYNAPGGNATGTGAAGAIPAVVPSVPVEPEENAEPAALVVPVVAEDAIPEEPDDGLSPGERLERAIDRAIDEALIAGQITPAQARERREELARERDERLREEAAE